MPLYHASRMALSAFRLGHTVGTAVAKPWIASAKMHPMTHGWGRQAEAALEVFQRVIHDYQKPAWNLPTTLVDGEHVAVTPTVVKEFPFMNLVHFKRDIAEDLARQQPNILLVAPMSGHYATLLRQTVEAFLPDHNVYITDWPNARDVPKDVPFDLDDYIDYVMDTLRHLNGDCAVFAVCQPSVPVLAAIARMEAMGDPAVPYQLTLAGGPVDTRKSPTAVNRLATERGADWFRHNVIHTVPPPNSGQGRMVYPGFLQLTGFMTMNLDRHMKAHRDLFKHLVQGDEDSVERHKQFYDEYLAVMDLTATFYLQTIENVFVDHHLPRGIMTHRNQPVDLSQITRPRLLTIEGGKDDITGAGQCHAALDLCSGIPARQKTPLDVPGIGHYGVFSGSKFRDMIAPHIKSDIAKAHGERAASLCGLPPTRIAPAPR